MGVMVELKTIGTVVRALVVDGVHNIYQVKVKMIELITLMCNMRPAATKLIPRPRMNTGSLVETMCGPSPSPLFLILQKGIYPIQNESVKEITPP